MLVTRWVLARIDGCYCYFHYHSGGHGGGCGDDDADGHDCGGDGDDGDGVSDHSTTLRLRYANKVVIIVCLTRSYVAPGKSRYGASLTTMKCQEKRVLEFNF